MTKKLTVEDIQKDIDQLSALISRNVEKMEGITNVDHKSTLGIKIGEDCRKLKELRAKSRALKQEH